MHWRSNYREYKRTSGQKGDPERMNQQVVKGMIKQQKRSKRRGKVMF
jgi:hypothetical protein